MSVRKIIESLEKLISIKTYLLNISQEKTGIVTEGSVDQLQALLVKERKYIRVLEQAESDRKIATDEWLLQNNLAGESITVTEILTILDDETEKQELEQTTIALTEIMLALKQQEQLNQELIQQSMKFVQMSLDVMNPSINQMNYGSKEKQTVSRSVFDSKA